jgi:hypothetical protein
MLSGARFPILTPKPSRRGTVYPSPTLRQSSQARPKGLTLKTIADPIDSDAKLNPEPPISAIRGMCRAINTNVPNDAEDTQGADHLITLKAVARVESVKHARKITFEDL